MSYDFTSSDKLNAILGAGTFKSGSISNDEVETKTGLTTEHLILCNIFSSRNNFKKALSDWKEDGKKMDYREIQTGLK